MNADPLAPDIEKLAGLDGKAPVNAMMKALPHPQPGITKKREY